MHGAFDQGLRLRFRISHRLATCPRHGLSGNPGIWQEGPIFSPIATANCRSMARFAMPSKAVHSAISRQGPGRKHEEKFTFSPLPFTLEAASVASCSAFF